MSAFSHSHEGMILTNTDTTILAVNSAFCTMSGYSEQQLIGQTPRIMQSGFHDRVFYNQMWQTVKTTGFWQGEVWDRKLDGSIAPKSLKIKVIPDADGNPMFYLVLMTDLTQLAELTRLANYDALTGLANRRLFKQRLEHDIEYAKRHSKQIALLYIDLDRFKHVNDSCGHCIGDELLVQTSRRLLAAVRAEDTVARIGGDEFLIILTEIRSADDARHVGHKIIQQINQPFIIEKHTLNIGCSIGYSLFPDHSNSIDTLINFADNAMYQAKRSGRNSLCC